MGAHVRGGQRQLFEGSAAKQPQGLEEPSPAWRSATLGAERGRLKPTDGAGSPRPCRGLAGPGSASPFRQGHGAGRRLAEPTPVCVPLSGTEGGPTGHSSSRHLGPLPRASSSSLRGIRRVATAAGAMTSAEGSFASTEIFMS